MVSNLEHFTELKYNEDVKRRFLQHSENTPEIRFECQEINSYPISWSFISNYFKFVLSFFLETFTVTKLS